MQQLLTMSALIRVALRAYPVNFQESRITLYNANIPGTSSRGIVEGIIGAAVSRQVAGVISLSLRRD